MEKKASVEGIHWRTTRRLCKRESAFRETVRQLPYKRTQRRGPSATAPNVAPKPGSRWGVKVCRMSPKGDHKPLNNNSLLRFQAATAGAVMDGEQSPPC